MWLSLEKVAAAAARAAGPAAAAESGGGGGSNIQISFYKQKVFKTIYKTNKVIKMICYTNNLLKVWRGTLAVVLPATKPFQKIA